MTCRHTPKSCWSCAPGHQLLHSQGSHAMCTWWHLLHAPWHIGLVQGPFWHQQRWASLSHTPTWPIVDECTKPVRCHIFDSQFKCKRLYAWASCASKQKQKCIFDDLRSYHPMSKPQMLTAAFDVHGKSLPELRWQVSGTWRQCPDKTFSFVQQPRVVPACSLESEAVQVG